MDGETMIHGFMTMDDIELDGRTVLLRVDVNSPIDPISGDILDDTRMRLHIPTIKELEDSKVVLIAHQSRPGRGDFTSLEKHSQVLSKLLNRDIEFIDELISRRVLDRISSMSNGEIVMLENTRMYSEDVAIKESQVDVMPSTYFVRRLSSVCDVFINDAFAASHRAQTSLVGFVDTMPMIAGRLLEHEVTALLQVTTGKAHPTVGILGGAKIDDSIAIAHKLASEGNVDTILTTGVVGNAMLHAAGYDIGDNNLKFVKKNSDDWDSTLKMAREIVNNYGDTVKYPSDVAVDIDGERKDVSLDELDKYRDNPIYDIGINTIEEYKSIIMDARYVFLNGPAGYFEKKPYDLGTVEIFLALAKTTAYTVVGGGHTGAMVEALGIKDSIDHVSSGGGAFISFLSGKRMPVIEALRESARRYQSGYYQIVKTA